MEEHIKKYAQIAQTGHYEPPKIEEEKDLIDKSCELGRKRFKKDRTI